MVPRVALGGLEASLMHLRLDAARECVISLFVVEHAAR